MHESQLAGTRNGRQLFSDGRTFLSSIITQIKPHLSRQDYIKLFATSDLSSEHTISQD
jgi:hypothetical protein